MKLNQITEFLSEHVLAVCAGFIALTIGLDLCLLGNPWPGLSEPWVSDIAYNFSWHMNGKMAQDIPYGQTWSTGLGKLFFLLHKAHGIVVSLFLVLLTMLCRNHVSEQFAKL